MVDRKVYHLLKTVNLPKMSTVKSFSRKNAALSTENCINLLTLDTLATAVQFEYIHVLYNSVRSHSHNNCLSPDQVELFFLDHFLSTF